VDTKLLRVLGNLMSLGLRVVEENRGGLEIEIRDVGAARGERMGRVRWNWKVQMLFLCECV
jgi:hypothetical protein